MIERINPDTLHKSPVFTQVAIIDASAKLVYVVGQNAMNTDGNIVGNDIATQTTQAMNNVVAALEAAGATFADVFKMTIYLVQGQSLQEAFEAAQQMQVMGSNPPTVSVIVVAGLVNPDFLIEIEAVAAIK